MDIRNGLITAYAGISASLGSAGQFNVNRSTGSYFTIFNNGRAWFGNGNPIDAGFQADIVGATRVQGVLSVLGNTLSIGTGGTTYQRNTYITPVNLAPTSSLITDNTLVGYADTHTTANINNTTVIGSLNNLNRVTATNYVLVGVGNRDYQGFGVSTISNTILFGNPIYTPASYSLSNVFYAGFVTSAPLNGTLSNYIGFYSTADSLTNNTLVFGSSGGGGITIDNVYFNGVRSSNGTTPTSVIINSAGAQGTNINGSNISIASGRATGTGQPGDIIFSTPNVTGSGTALQALSSRWTIKGYNGVLTNKFPYTFTVTGSLVMDVTGSVLVTGSIFMSPSSSFVLPLSASSAPQTGSAYWSGSSLFIWNGLRYMSSSFA